MQKYPKIKRIGDEQNAGILDTGEILIQEKLDGANFRFSYDYDEGRFVFGSRNFVWENEKDIPKVFDHAVEYVREYINRDTVYQYADDEEIDPTSIVFYGEAMHPHTLDYDWDTIPSFIGFDAWDPKFGFWHYPMDVFIGLDLPPAPQVYRGSAEDFEFDDNYEVPQSKYRDGKAEGIVIKNIETGQRAKLRSPEFLEAHGTNPGGDDPADYDPSDSEILARRFATETRILKEIHKMRDEGNTVEMGMMEDLWRRVFEDIIEEEYFEIFLGNHTIHTQEFRSEVAGRTADVLQQYLSRPENSVLNEVTV